MEVSLRELKARLSAYLRRVAGGEEATVTLRRRPLARLVRAEPQTQQEPSEEEVRHRRAAIPGAILGEPGKIKGSRRPIRIRKGEKTLAETVLENRR